MPGVQQKPVDGDRSRLETDQRRLDGGSNRGSPVDQRVQAIHETKIGDEHAPIRVVWSEH